MFVRELSPDDLVSRAKMARIAYISIGMNSTIHGSIELGRRLNSAGHELIFLSYKQIGNQVRANGFDFVYLEADDRWKRIEAQSPRPAARPGNLPRLWRWGKKMRQLRRRSMQLEELDAAIKQLQPDLVLIDIECHVAIMASREWGLPVALPMFWLSIFKQKDRPPLNTSLFPPKSTVDRVAVWLAWAKLHAGIYKGQLKDLLSGIAIRAWFRPVFYSAIRYSALADLARRRGYRLKDEVDRFQWLRPYMYMRLPILSLNIYELDFPHSVHPNLSYVGPMLNRERKETHLPSKAAQPWSDYKRGRANNNSQSRPLIYCAFGSFLASDPMLINEIIGLAKRRKDWDFLIGLGATRTSDDFEKPTQNVILMDWAPQVEVLGYASCAVVHAGIATINECIYNEVPMVVMSTHTNDQDGTAARVEFHGLGVVLEKNTVTAEQLEQNIEALLADQSTKSALARMSSLLADYEKQDLAVKNVERLIGLDLDRSTISEQHRVNDQGEEHQAESKRDEAE